VDFRPCAAALIARTFFFLEQITEPLREYAKLEPFSGKPPAYLLGVGVAKRWLELLDTLAGTQ
jgi:hypothetical protein